MSNNASKLDRRQFFVGTAACAIPAPLLPIRDSSDYLKVITVGRGQQFQSLDEAVSATGGGLSSSKKVLFKINSGAFQKTSFLWPDFADLALDGTSHLA